MYLSKIEIIGFKSFAQRINVNFDSGVTAIVGPNGCGKTNIVDAIRWALGEQRYSTLRSDKMEDVIFNGTKDRKPLGLAEVSLTIENTRGILPTEYSEVTITRRVFRSGESEYLLNKIPCRLKDIIDLFMDTGMGSDAYSVIELKMVETILSDKTDERRRLFEEAAGVTKYKHRRKAAIRKLESVQQDLARVNDIVKEVQKTVSSLERQAKKAEQYNEVSSRLRQLEIDLLEREYAYLLGKLRPLEEKFTLATTDKSEIDAALAMQERKVDELRDALTQIESRLTEALSASAAQSQAVHRAEEKMLVANERRSSLSDNVSRYEKEKDDLRAQDSALSDEKASLSGRRRELLSASAESEKAFASLREDHAGVARRLDGKKYEVQGLKDSLLEVAHELVQKRGEQERLKTKIDNSRGRMERSSEESSLYAADIARNEQLIAQLTSQDRELRKEFADAEIELYNREKAKKELKGEIDRLEKRVLEITHDIERKKSKCEFLRRMVESHEGFPEGAKYLLSNEAWKRKKMTTVADVIRTSEKYRPALETALGEYANVLIVDRAEDGFAAVEELARQRKGKATFLCLQWVPKIRRRGRPRVPAGAVWAIDAVQCEDRYRPLMSFLLDDVLLLEQVADARQAASSLTAVRCIASDGSLISASGVLRGGSRRLDEGGAIDKKTQIEEIERDIASAEAECQSVKTKQITKEVAHNGFDLTPYSEAVKLKQKEMSAIEMRIAQLEFEKRRAQDGIERNSAENRDLERDILELEQAYERVGAQLSEVEKTRTARENLADGAVRELEELEQLWAEKTRSLNDLEIQLVTSQGEVRNIERDLERADARGDDIRLTLERREAEVARASEEISRLAAEGSAIEAELSRLRSEQEAIDASKKEVELAYSARRSELHTTELTIKDERRLHEDSVARSHELEMKISELKSSIEHVKLRSKEEFEIDLELKTYPEDEWVDFAQLREEVKILKDRIRVLGAINFAAFDEFTTENDRLNFLTQQRDDLIEAEKTLLSTIEEINATAQRFFLETFGKIRENFIATFKELFLEGDECDLRLEENVDPLEATIEIIAKPRGKRPTSIDLLSGGEKTLTAIALLFAIYLVKPSPFCILDEVDAPLDDSNIDRYTRILRKFSGNTQFIVVTHNKRTMEAASALYGITMEEQGVSKIVTVRFNEEARVRAATVTN